MTFANYQLQVVKNAERANERWVYRGHANPSWPLITTYGRFYRRAYGVGTHFTIRPFEQMLDQFIRRASETAEVDYSKFTKVQQMALAQHYGLPTPLLDWTHSPYIAAYFAVTDSSASKEVDVEFCVHAMDAYDLTSTTEPDDTELVLQDDGIAFQFLDTSAFFARRVSRQAGCFTYQGFDACLIDRSASSPLMKLKMKKYLVRDRQSTVIRELALMGITGGVLFDDLDYIARDIVQAEYISHAPRHG